MAGVRCHRCESGFPPPPPPPFQKLSQSFAQTSLFTVSCDIFPPLVRFVSNFALSRSLSHSLAHPPFSPQNIPPYSARSALYLSHTLIPTTAGRYIILILIYPSLFSTSALFFFFFSSTPVSSIHVLPPSPLYGQTILSFKKSHSIASPPA